MEELRKKQIEKLANELAEDHITGSVVDPYYLAEDYDIDVIYEDYQKAFKGIIWQRNENFYIHLNSRKIFSPYFADGRFTCCHELGHYFIREHQEHLKNGKSISFDGNEVWDSNSTFEQEANYFAANLLLPTNIFLNSASTLSKGLPGIFSIKKDHRASVTCTAIRYVTLGLSPSLLVRRETNGKIKKWISPSFIKQTQEDPLIIFNHQRQLMGVEKKYHEDTKIHYMTGYTILGNWISNSKAANQVVYEETFQTEHWSLILITLLD